jgi:hypothetical protein
MYMAESADIDQFNKLHDFVQWRNPWFYENMKDQTHVREFEIQKYWANKIDCVNKTVAILNSGFGFYAVPFAFEKAAKYVTCYDMDPTTHDVSWWIHNRHKPNFNHVQLNTTFDEKGINKAHIYINTSCEHSYYMKDLLPKGAMCVMSGNNLTKRGHINLIESCEHLQEQCELSEIINEDVMEFDYEDELGKRTYQQFFIIGRK